MILEDYELSTDSEGPTSSLLKELGVGFLILEL
jgi:hypothetical protein